MKLQIWLALLTIIADQIEAYCLKESYKQSNREEYVKIKKQIKNKNLDFPELQNCIDMYKYNPSSTADIYSNACARVAHIAYRQLALGYSQICFYHFNMADCLGHLPIHIYAKLNVSNVFLIHQQITVFHTKEKNWLFSFLPCMTISNYMPWFEPSQWQTW